MQFFVMYSNQIYYVFEKETKLLHPATTLITSYIYKYVINKSPPLF